MLGLRAATGRKTLQFVQLRCLHASLPANATSTSTTESEDTPAKWTPDSIRTGVIARKKGMTAIWNDQGVRVPVTVLQVCINQSPRVSTDGRGSLKTVK